MYFDGEKYVHPYGCMLKSDVMASVKKLYEDKYQRKHRGWLKMLLTDNFAKMNKSFFGLVRKDLQLRITNFCSIIETTDNLSPYLGIFLLYTEYIPYEEIISELYNNDRLIEMFCMVLNRKSLRSKDATAVFMLGFDKLVSKPKIISNIVYAFGSLFRDDSIPLQPIINNSGRISSIKLSDCEDSPVESFSDLEKLTKHGLYAYELFSMIFTNFEVDLDGIRDTKWFLCDESLGKYYGQTIRISFKFNLIGSKWITEDMDCLGEESLSKRSNVCCTSCAKYVKLLKIHNVYLMTTSLFDILRSKLIKKDLTFTKSACLEEVYFDNLLNQELKEIQDLQAIEDSLI